jgi:O-antigen ligase
MTALARAGWLLSAVLAAIVVSGVHTIDQTGKAPIALAAAIAIICVLRPRWGLAVVAALAPIAWWSAAHWWNPQVAWAETLVCAALAGLGADAVRARGRVPRAVGAPAFVLIAIVLAALAAALQVLATREGPGSWQRMADLLTHGYLVDHYFAALHAGMLLVEGLLLFTHAARLAETPGTLRLVAGATTVGSAAAAICTLTRLEGAAARAPSFWPALFELAGRLRLNVHYVDFNAAGSVYAMALLAGSGVVWVAARRTRPAWILAALLIAAGLWLTSSRIAILAVPLAAAAGLLLPSAAAGRRQAIGAAAIAAGAFALLVLVALILPQRGIQHSSLLAADIRLGLLQTGARMIHAHPAFGVGLGAFQPRSAEFSSPELIAKFPVVAQGENAHNNFVQVAAETGIAGGLAFAWTILAALLAMARRAVTGDRQQQLTFAAIVAFVITMLAGHPLLVPEAGYAFWLLAGTAAGAALAETGPAQSPQRQGYVLAALLAAVVLTLPLRVTAAVRDTDLDHVGIGVSPIWHVSPDDRRYREAMGEATLFEPTGAFKLSINPRTTEPVRLEISLDGRLADIVLLEPSAWNDIVIPARNVQSGERFRRMYLRTVGDAHPPLWITKDEPISPR